MSNGSDDQPADRAANPPDAEPVRGERDDSARALREEVEAKYDFDDFGPEDMAEMSVEEWEAAFDPETWIVGEELLDRVQEDLERRVAERDVFAVVERVDGTAIAGGDDEGTRVLAYSDSGYAVVYPDGTVEGRGTVLRDVKPTVALCSMESYDVEPAPEGAALPAPDEVPEASGEFGNLMLQIVAAGQVLAGLVLLGAWIVSGLNIIAAAIGLVFVAVGVFLFLVVANARLSDRFRSEQFRDRLRAAGLESGRRPEFLPLADPESGEGTTSGESSEEDGRSEGGEEPAAER